MFIKTEGHVKCQLKVSGHEFKVRTIRVVMCFLPELPIEVWTMCEWCAENSWFLPTEHQNLKWAKKNWQRCKRILATHSKFRIYNRSGHMKWIDYQKKKSTR